MLYVNVCCVKCCVLTLLYVNVCCVNVAMQVTISLVDVNDTPPIFTSYPSNVSISEDSPVGTVIGSLIVSGNSVDMDISNGTFEALYSPEALDNARLNLKSSRFQILSWWE